MSWSVEHVTCPISAGFSAHGSSAAVVFINEQRHVALKSVSDTHSNKRASGGQGKHFARSLGVQGYAIPCVALPPASMQSSALRSR